MKEKAIVKKTSEILDVEEHWSVKMMSVTIELPDELKDVFKEPIDVFGHKIEYKDKYTKSNKEGDHYILSDGKEYMGHDLIVGIDNIRDYKVNKLID